MSETTMTAGELAAAYLAMAQVFSYPKPESCQRLAEHGLIDPALTAEAMQIEYVAAFETGRGNDAVPLFEGMHRKDLGRDGIFEELLRFYEFFDAKLSETDREYPDHLVTELEFLAWLCLQEQSAERDGRDAAPFRRAARDFLARHLAAWLPVFRQRLDATDTTYAQYGPALDDLVVAHRSRLDALVQAPGEQR